MKQRDSIAEVGSVVVMIDDVVLCIVEAVGIDVSGSKVPVWKASNAEDRIDG